MWVSESDVFALLSGIFMVWNVLPALQKKRIDFNDGKIITSVRHDSRMNAPSNSHQIDNKVVLSEEEEQPSKESGRSNRALLIRSGWEEIFRGE